MSMSVEDLPAATREAVRYHRDRLAVYVPPQERTIQWSEVSDPSEWATETDTLEHLAAHRRKEAIATIDNLCAVTITGRPAFEVAIRGHTGLTTLDGLGAHSLQRHLWIEAMKERRQ